MTISKDETGAAAAKWTANGGVATMSSNGFGAGGRGGGGKGGQPPPTGNGDSNASATVSESTSSPSFTDRNIAILFLLFLDFLVSPYNRWIPVSCRLGASEGGGEIPPSSLKYAQINHSWTAFDQQ